MRWYDRPLAAILTAYRTLRINLIEARNVRRYQRMVDLVHEKRARMLASRQDYMNTRTEFENTYGPIADKAEAADA